MIIYEKAEVVDLISEEKAIQILKVSSKHGESKAVNYLQLNPRLSVGDKIYLNKTATYLDLGTGGYDFVIMPESLENEVDITKNNGHIMKLRYTPYQFSVLSVEEQASKYHDLFLESKMLDGLTVVIGELHSMLPIFVTLYRNLEITNNREKARIVYIMTDGAALSVAFSKHVSTLKRLGWLNETITIGNAFGGDLEAVNIYTGLIAAKYILNADLVIVIMGPGITGTGTLLGHTGLEQGTIINAVASLKGLPISIVRASMADERKRQHGISHHTLSNLLYVSIAKSQVPFPGYICQSLPEAYQTLLRIEQSHTLVPIDIDRQKVETALSKYPDQIKTMGRTYYDDPIYFDFVASTAYYTFNILNKQA